MMGDITYSYQGLAKLSEHSRDVQGSSRVAVGGTTCATRITTVLRVPYLEAFVL